MKKLIKTYVRIDVVNTLIKQLNSLFSEEKRQDWKNFCKKYSLDPFGQRKDILNQFYTWFELGVQNGLMGQELKKQYFKIDAGNEINQNFQGIVQRRDLIGHSIKGQPWGYDTRNMINPNQEPFKRDDGTIIDYSKELDYISSSIYEREYFFIYLTNALKGIDFQDGSINIENCLFNLEDELYKMSSENYDRELIEDFSRVIRTLLNDGVKEKTLFYSIKSNVYLDIDDLYNLFNNDILKWRIDYKKRQNLK